MPNLDENRQYEIIHDLLAIYIERRHKLITRKLLWPMFMSSSATAELADLDAKIDKLHWDWAKLSGTDQHFDQAMRLIHEIEVNMNNLRRKLDDNDNGESLDGNQKTPDGE
jgi:hypothetical protein